MDRYRLPCSVPHCVFQCAMITVNLLLSHLRSTSQLCARASTLLFDAHSVAQFARQSQSFQRKLLSRARNVARNAPSSCLAPDSQQEIFLSIRFTSLSRRGGTRRLMVKPIVHEEIVSRSAMIPVRRDSEFPLVTRSHQRAQHKPATSFTVREEIFSVGRACTRISNAPACICLSLHSGRAVPHLRYSRVLPHLSL